MSIKVRPEVSTKNPYWINKHRHYELKHFCLQYPIWKQTYLALSELNSYPAWNRISSSNTISDQTAKCAIKRIYYLERINLIEKIAKDAGEELQDYILKAVTENLSYTYLKARLNIPCGRDMFYERYRRFFWLLDKERD